MQKMHPIGMHFLFFSSKNCFVCPPTEERAPRRFAHTQYDMVDLGIDNLLATSGTVSPPSVTIIAASSLNSFM